MKLILTLFLLSIFGQIQQLNCQCFDLIRQYNQCKHLKMEFKKSDYIEFVIDNTTDYMVGPQEKYFVNSTANSDLTDRFYRKLMSKHMNFNKAMKLFLKIYTETDNCTSEFCKCVSLGVIDYHGNYSLYFRNKDVFPHVKRIIEDFNKQFESNLKPYSELWYNKEFEPYYNQNLSSLAQFCIKYDYSYKRYEYYNKIIYGRFYRIEYLISEYGCFWEVLFERKTLDFKKLSNSDLSKLLECQIKRTIWYSSTREEARFLVINMWATAFPNFIWDKNMTAQIDSFIPNGFTHRYKPDLFLSAKLNTYSYSKRIGLTNRINYKYNTIDLNGETQKRSIYKVFDSPPLRIDCQWVLSNDNKELIWEWANFTFKYNDSTSRTISANMSFNEIHNHNPFEPEIDISNQTLISDRIQITKNSYMKREYFLIVDYKYNITVEVSWNQIILYFPRQLRNQTSGLMIDELQNNDLIDRKKRSTDSVYPFEMSCQTMCEKNKNKFTVMDKMESLIASEIDFNYCLNDCFKQHLEKLK